MFDSKSGIGGHRIPLFVLSYCNLLHAFKRRGTQAGHFITGRIKVKVREQYTNQQVALKRLMTLLCCELTLDNFLIDHFKGTF